MVAVAAAALVSSPYLRERSIAVWTDIQEYQTTNAQNSSSERIEFWKKSAEFVAEAPLAGHGTGKLNRSTAITAAICSSCIGSIEKAKPTPHACSPET